MEKVLDYPTADAPLLRIGALEALRVDDSAGPCAAVLVVHGVVPDPRYGTLRAEIGDPDQAEDAWGRPDPVADRARYLR